MRTFNQYLKSLEACQTAIDWAGDKTIEQVVTECHRGDWLLWLANKCDIGLQPLTLAKGHCANTVRHLMKDDRSIKAVDTAIAFGEGRASREELDSAYAHAAFAADDAADAYAYADAYAADAVAAYAAFAASAAAAFAAAAAAAFAASAAALNRKETADICRKYIGDLIIQKVNETLNPTNQ